MTSVSLLFATHSPLAHSRCRTSKKQTITYLEGALQKAPTGDEEVSFARHWTVLTRELQESEPAAPQQSQRLGTGPSTAPDQVYWWGRSRVHPGGLGRGGHLQHGSETHLERPIHHLTGMRRTDSIVPAGIKAPG